MLQRKLGSQLDVVRLRQVMHALRGRGQQPQHQQLQQLPRLLQRVTLVLAPRGAVVAARVRPRQLHPQPPDRQHWHARRRQQRRHRTVGPVERHHAVDADAREAAARRVVVLRQELAPDELRRAHTRGVPLPLPLRQPPRLAEQRSVGRCLPRSKVEQHYVPRGRHAQAGDVRAARPLRALADPPAAVVHEAHRHPGGQRRTGNVAARCVGGRLGQLRGQPRRKALRQLHHLIPPARLRAVVRLRAPGSLTLLATLPVRLTVRPAYRGDRRPLHVVARQDGLKQLAHRGVPPQPQRPPAHRRCKLLVEEARRDAALVGQRGDARFGCQGMPAARVQRILRGLPPWAGGPARGLASGGQVRMRVQPHLLLRVLPVLPQRKAPRFGVRFAQRRQS
mmetsp:Transcript_39139/g.100012  ORF Transcript_39139/g.100012 Transcript_39139/m.100012 type:complete len:393 (-) Transcript_39139:48-1226(-)